MTAGVISQGTYVFTQSGVNVERSEKKERKSFLSLSEDRGQIIQFEIKLLSSSGLLLLLGNVTENCCAITLSFCGAHSSTLSLHLCHFIKVYRYTQRETKLEYTRDKGLCSRSTMAPTRSYCLHTAAVYHSHTGTPSMRAFSSSPPPPPLHKLTLRLMLGSVRISLKRRSMLNFVQN